MASTSKRRTGSGCSTRPTSRTGQNASPPTTDWLGSGRPPAPIATRGSSEDGDLTEYLEFDRYDEVADRRLRSLREDLESRDGVYEVRLHHTTAVVEAGEDIVFVVVLAGHRSEAFRTVEDGINRLKAEVPLFKKEVTASEEFWAHER